MPPASAVRPRANMQQSANVGWEARGKHHHATGDETPNTKTSCPTKHGGGGHAHMLRFWCLVSSCERQRLLCHQQLNVGDKDVSMRVSMWGEALLPPTRPAADLHTTRQTRF